MADAPEPFTYAELVRAEVAVTTMAARLREHPEAATRVAQLDTLGRKLARHAAAVLVTGDVDAQRAELYR